MDLPAPTPEDIAITLGIIQGKSAFLTKPHKTEEDRVVDIRACIYRLQVSSSKEKQEIIFSEFCAKYLPTMMSRWVEGKMLPGEPPDFSALVNGYLWVLLSAYKLPIFAKYLRSAKPIAAPGKSFVSLLAQRITRFGILNEHIPLETPLQDGIKKYILEPTFWAVCLLRKGWTLSPRRFEPGKILGMPEDIVVELLPQLETWQNQRGYKALADESRRLIFLLTNVDRLYVGSIWRGWKGSTDCALPGCEETINLKACAKCLAVYYCCPEHQRAHWNSKEVPAHKPMCFKTEY
ncbi:hypothetical protein BDN72DRAFT_854419 [Pluteus cervinus]|uniref:Uncharacterized protein n=1 Tax=Pluteus cervinus TaxID=181527 RepID=A0ACD3B6Z3_9AGAR|nr:hypothetical protein BDN72DRAFT_854419 [Pluteus cervinus]